MADALGMIECRSFPAMVEAADAMVKAARVELVSYEKTGGGYTTVIIRGDVAAVKAACDAGQTAATRVGELVAVHIIARPHSNVLAVCGDGGFHSSSHDLETAARYRLPVVALVMKDGSFGLIKHYQLKGHGRADSGTVEFGDVDFVKLAEANGCRGIRATSRTDLASSLRSAFESHQPTVIEVPVAYDYSLASGTAMPS